MSLRTLSLIPAVGASLYAGYVTSDEDRRREAYHTAQASYRITNLISTVGTIVMDYGYAMTFNNSNTTANHRYTELSNEILRLQTRQEVLTIKQMKSKDPKEIADLLKQIGLTRIELDSTSEEIGERFRLGYYSACLNIIVI